ncbi:hypothetical protein [Maribacter cobaltidurans]|uniref:Uncharacterized protein n=1 Tax=Maribacter cobaltidurans TaxID=1178778 RepID=A0A223V6W4_9FLAO|nr:hypothetical protein [Maribacter cobaltidurans]ASV30748.1 hypothetical protein CJ263_11260 [Maribacter cobaltidurans]
MKSNRLKNSISFIFLALFMATKLIGLHVLTHDDPDCLDSCAICHNIAADSHTPAVLEDSGEPLSPAIEFVPQNEVAIGYDFQVSTTTCPSLLFSRPPPSI